ncbi:unnamed protein product [Aphanomyces euteiches]|uniref:Saposin B-type domain-containing protein n=1 Tax=Aphanomyces euteiches TaxID=100861 RepID=A0A6G0WL99_9STRA|nr:hypothetical protein Ae201684_014047 [Aphanomyces euteiches]KAH9096201.1 hypothetical protein Ae201684P_009438 [Aphanomyces euteiches]KAH9101928.1 hypothetical protein AeMF1_021374 [Aphanomyces euteiches]KAH9153423.1 hypothetical protein AeRB84_004328 [Aphanomyces euteiches]KAH9161201.1 hypothetical protein LEN26_001532 [Aphanomyces euteiches]
MRWICAVGLVLSVDAWVKRRWDHSKTFNKLGLNELACESESKPTSCCLCQTFMHDIETHLNATENDHAMDVVFRISEEKKQIPYSRSEARILEVLESVCKDVKIPAQETSSKVQYAVKNACEGFVDEFADDLIALYYNNLSPQQNAMCVERLQVCDAAAKDEL